MMKVLKAVWLFCNSVRTSLCRNGVKKGLTEARLSINDQTEPQRPQHLQLFPDQLDL